MERLTKPDWKSLFSWECCGQTDFCLRGRDKEKECVNCIVPKLYARVAMFEDMELTYEKAAWMKEVIEVAFDRDTSRLERAYEVNKADKDGRVLVMPCKFGDKLYRVFGEEIQEFTVSNIKYMGLQHRWSVDTTPFILYAENLIGTELFLTREEAERAMEGRKDGV